MSRGLETLSDGFLWALALLRSVLLCGRGLPWAHPRNSREQLEALKRRYLLAGILSERGAPSCSQQTSCVRRFFCGTPLFGYVDEVGACDPVGSLSDLRVFCGK